MASIASRIRQQVEEIEEEMANARRILQEASQYLPRLYQAMALLAAEDGEEIYIPLMGEGASRTDRILHTLAEAKRPMRPIEIARAMNDDPKAIRTMLVYAKRRGLVQDHEGHYYVPGTFNLPAEIRESSFGENLVEAA